MHRNVSKEIIIQAIQSIERESSSIAHKRVPKEFLRGDWELVFSSLISSGYFPIKEVCSFYEGFELNSSWGPFSLGGFRGDSLISDLPLVVEFQSRVFKLGPLTVKVPPKPRSYRFLFIDDLIAVALSSSGGKTILQRVLDISDHTC